MLEGREIFAPLNVTQHWNKHDFVVVDTQDILFIAAGTFSDLHLTEADQAGRLRRRPATPTPSPQPPRDREGAARLRLPGRVPRPPAGARRAGAAVRGRSLPDHDRPARRGGARVPGAAEDGRRRPALLRRGPARRSRSYCLRRRTGARSLRTIVEEICHDIMFEAPERKGETVTVDAATIAAHLDRLERQRRTTARRQVKISRAVRRPATAACSRSSSSRPRPTPARQALERTIRELAELSPAFVSVTYGAGGSTRAKTIELVQWIEREARLTRDGPPDLRRRQPGRDRRGARPAGRRPASRTSWRCAAIRPPGRRTFQRDRRRLRLRRRSGAFIRKRFGQHALPGRRRQPRGARRVPRPRSGHQRTSRPRWTPAWTSSSPSCSSTTASTSTSSSARARRRHQRPDRPRADADPHRRRDRTHDRAVAAPASRRRCARSSSAAATTTRRSRRWASPRPPPRPSSCFTAARRASTSTR